MRPSQHQVKFPTIAPLLSTLLSSPPMDGGGPCNDIRADADPITSGVSGEFARHLTESLSNLSIEVEGESTSPVQTTEKDPRRIARQYQVDLCKKALEENVIVYLGTGCGKTHIAVLLIYEMGHLIKKPENNICVFLAPTVALVQQQAKVIQDSIDFKVGTYCGSSKRLKTPMDWKKELEQYEVFVMTPQILLRNLSHCFIKMEQIALLIFDECHYAQRESDHPYAEIMKIFYKNDSTKLPRIFGMTASPKMGKGASINGLETLLHSKVYCVEDKGELEQFVTSPKFNVYYYDSSVNDSSQNHETYLSKLNEIKHQCVSMLRESTIEHSNLQNIKKMLQKVHGNLIVCLESLGIWGALQASNILLRGDHSERNELIEAEANVSDDSICDKYLTQACSLFESYCVEAGSSADLSSLEILKEPFISWKLLRLIGILSNFRLRENMKCIIFVNRIITARSLSYILRNLKLLRYWKCDFLVGVHSGLKSMSRKNTAVILERFKSDELNLLVATKVGEEGLDIQTCGLVIRFDLPETVASFIQSRGRARMPQSEYAFLVDRHNRRDLNLLEHFKRDEEQMNKDIASKKSTAEFVELELWCHKVDSTGATISAGQSISLLHKYCSKLPHDEYFNPKPSFYYYDEPEGTVCALFLPSNAPFHRILSAPQASIETAKKDACLKACKELHGVGALNDYLLPDQDDRDKESLHDSDADSCDELDLQSELHEMLIPTVLRKPCTTLEDVSLKSYFIKFFPHPRDRVYKTFALYLHTSLPAEAEKMKVDLPLDHGRHVITEFIPSRPAKFDKDKIALAELFQQISLEAILDRDQLITDIVSLDKHNFSSSISTTYYLLLPVILDEHEESITVDWELIRRCLSSPIFRDPNGVMNDMSSDLNNCLQLADGPQNVDDIVNSLVYAPCKHTFFFVSDIVKDKNGYSPFNDTNNHVEHYADKFGLHLSYPMQPLLKAKQLFILDNLLRKKGSSEPRVKIEHFVELPPEICKLKIIGFSKEIGSSLSLLPSIMLRLESLLVAIELKERLSASFSEGKEVKAHRVLEALTTEKCCECFSYERLEVLGDAFLKFAVGRHLFLLHEGWDEGQLTRKRSSIVSNSNLRKLATRRNLQPYIRNQSFDPSQYFAPGRPCSVVCSKEEGGKIHYTDGSSSQSGTKREVRCDKHHQFLSKKTIADVVEALIGAFIVDSGFKAATAFLQWIGIQVEYTELQVRQICLASSTFMPLAVQRDCVSVENLLGYKFVHKGLLLQALVHPSYNDHSGGCYQRLEFLGDAVLDYLITSYMYSAYPKLKPGQLTDLRSAFVSNSSLAEVAVAQSLYKYIFCDSSSLLESMDKYADFIKKSALEKPKVEGPTCPKALGDLVESCIGAALLDTGFDLNRVWKLMVSFLDPIMHLSRLQLHPVRELQELCQSYNLDLQFTPSKKDGKYSVNAEVSEEKVCVTATNPSRRTAKKMAAKLLLAKLKSEGHTPKSKSLEEVLKSMIKQEEKLIGYDESPVDIGARYSNGSADPTGGHHPSDDCELKIYPVNGTIKLCNPSLGPIRQSTIEKSNRKAELETKGGLGKKPAKSQLYEICAANCWKEPLFECCKEEGPSHLREFTFKVVVGVEESQAALECYGEVRSNKKAAEDSAAEGALWYLKHQGYLA